VKIAKSETENKDIKKLKKNHKGDKLPHIHVKSTTLFKKQLRNQTQSV
jgi:hypothetical protein